GEKSYLTWSALAARVALRGSPAAALADRGEFLGRAPGVWSVREWATIAFPQAGFLNQECHHEELFSIVVRCVGRAEHGPLFKHGPRERAGAQVGEVGCRNLLWPP